MRHRLAALTASVMTLAVIAPAAASAAPISKSTQFTNRSGSVTCGVEIHFPSKPASRVLCSARGIPAPKQRGIGDSGFADLGVLGRPKLLQLSQNSFVAGRKATLGRGRLWNQLGVTCHVAQTTVMCFNGDNHGFVIGNRRYRSF
jgi:hypothetical protein